MEEVGGDFLQGDDGERGMRGDCVEDCSEASLLEEGVEPDVPGEEGD